MMTTLERRHTERARIPCNIPVELTDAARRSQFEADAVDLSVGGLSLRTEQLPALGSQLFCSFEAMPGGAHVLGRGEVVWRQPKGDQGGEFGLRFIEVDPKNQALIDEMVAERIARIEAPVTQPEPVMAKLELENVSTPVVVRLVHASDTEALFEQSLDDVTVGKSVIAYAGASLLRGHIASIKLRMEGTTPRLLVTTQLVRDPAKFGEFEWGEPGSDTDPDVFAQSRAQASEGAPRSAVAKLGPAAAIGGNGHEVVEEATVAIAEDAELAARQERLPTLSGIGSPLPDPIYARDDARAQQLPLFRRDRPTEPDSARLHLSYDDRVDPSEVPDRVFADDELLEELDEDIEEDVDDPLEVPEHEQTVHAGGEQSQPLVHMMGFFAMIVGTANALGERMRDTVDRWRGIAAPGGRSKPRRVTTVAQREAASTQRRTARFIAVGVLGVATVAALVYALVPSYNGEHMHPEDSEEQAQEEEVEDATNETAANAATEAPNHPVAHANPNASGSTKVKPALEDRPSAPSTADTRSRPAALTATTKPAAAPPTAPSGAVGSAMFGRKEIKNGRRFVLRMAEPVRLLRGTADAGGFSVIVPDNRALEKAAPVMAGHPAVARAVILNHKDRSAELNVRFVAGTSPAYRVTGQGSALEVTLSP